MSTTPTRGGTPARKAVPARKLLLAALAALTLAGCSLDRSLPPAPTTPTTPTPEVHESTSAPTTLPNAFPDLSCDQLVGAADWDALFGERLTSSALSSDEAPLLQTGGMSCRWSDGDRALEARVAGDGGDHWAAFNSAFAHNEWAMDIGDRSGTTCEATAQRCEIHVRNGEVFLELVATRLIGSETTISDHIRALAAAIVDVVPQPHPVERAEATRAGRCDDIVPVGALAQALDADAATVRYLSPSETGYSLLRDVRQEEGVTECGVSLNGTTTALTYSVAPGGAWVVADRSRFADLTEETVGWGDGAEAFVSTAPGGDRRALMAADDDDLLSVRFADPDDATRAVSLLNELTSP